MALLRTPQAANRQGGGGLIVRHRSRYLSPGGNKPHHDAPLVHGAGCASAYRGLAETRFEGDAILIHARRAHLPLRLRNRQADSCAGSNDGSRIQGAFLRQVCVGFIARLMPHQDHGTRGVPLVISLQLLQQDSLAAVVYTRAILREDDIGQPDRRNYGPLDYLDVGGCRPAPLIVPCLTAYPPRPPLLLVIYR